MEMLNPLMANTMGLSFRQPGDMGRYVADNDPGGIAAGFSNLEDFLAAGNKIPEYRLPGGLIQATPPGGSLSQFTPPEGGIMQLPGGNTTISQITQPNAITSVAGQQGLNITNTDGLNKFVNNMINNRLKEFFGGIMGMLNV
tara:strand:+ start:36 stop:461 length:426 start_codon:yes stop_codon:yes gene_type:complete